MKCQRPGTDQEVELFCYVDGTRSTEFKVPRCTVTDNNTVECMVAVNSGNRITISGTFSGSVRQICFDVLADGSYVGHRRLETSEVDAMEFIKSRKIEVKTALDSPDTPGRVSILSHEKVLEGNLHVKDVNLNRLVLHREGTRFGVGCLVVIVSLTQHPHETYNTGYSSMCVGSWQRRSQENITNSDITPTHALEVRSTKGEVSTRRAARHSKGFKQTRHGPEPWARLVFHYRSIEVIRKAGYALLGSEVHALKPLSSLGDFAIAKEEKNILAYQRFGTRQAAEGSANQRFNLNVKASAVAGAGRQEIKAATDVSKLRKKQVRRSSNPPKTNMEETDQKSIPDLEDFDIENLMTMLQDAEQSHPDGQLQGSDESHLSCQPVFFGLEESAEAFQEYMQHYGEVLDERSFDATRPLMNPSSQDETFRQYVSPPPVNLSQTTPTALSDVLSPGIIGAYEARSAGIHSDVDEKHVPNSCQIQPPPSTSALTQRINQASNINLATMFEDDRLDNILVARRARPCTILADPQFDDLPAKPHAAKPAQFDPVTTSNKASSELVMSSPSSSHTQQNADTMVIGQETSPAFTKTGKTPTLTTSDQNLNRACNITTKAPIPTSDIAKLKPEVPQKVPNEDADEFEKRKLPTLRTMVTIPPVPSTKHDRDASVERSLSVTLTPKFGPHPAPSSESPPSKKARLSELETRKLELIKKLQLKRAQKIHAQQVLEQKQRQREQEERAYLQAERLRTEKAERQRIEAEERAREAHEKQREEEALREIEQLEKQLGNEDMEIEKLAQMSEKFFYDWDEQKSLWVVENLEREMENEDWTMDEIDKIQAELEATDEQKREALSQVYG